MKITNAKVIVTSPGRNFVTLKVFTDEGIYGLGDATLNGREMAVVSYLEEHCIPALIGKDPMRTEEIWHYFYNGAYWKRGPVTMTAIAAIDVALWDIKAKALGTPLYNLLGGKSREKVLVYTHAFGKSIEETIEDVARKKEEGLLAIRVQSGIPGIGAVYGVPKSGGRYEPAEKGLPKEYTWDSTKYLNFLPTLFEKLRLEFGNDIQFLHDVHHRLTPIEAARLAKELEPYHLFWLEDPIPGELQEGFRIIRQHSRIPIATGEVFNSIYDYTTLFTEQLIDYIRMPITHGGGITHLLKVAAFASVYHIQTGFHGPTDLSPVSIAVSIHLDLAINNFGIQEYMPHEEIVFDVFKVNYHYKNGYFYIGDEPGIGVDIDEEKAKKYPYKMASLPINRRFDGTITYW
ncbi:MAG: D-galactonate dehydratase family protein [Candidatus Marinimicrobia bacterium]|nr:D-galactonate dehydratase family protein [Candidatus Neomarinimicrobiota bacterium]